MEEGVKHLNRVELQKLLKKTQAEIAGVRREMKELEDGISREKKRQHIAKLMQAGRVLEDAGVLYGYNENSLYLLLVMNKEYLLSGDNTTPSGKFDMMHGLASLT